jgi:hydrogenase maturation protease
MSGLPLVIGYGNPLRADDGVGWHVAQQLAGAVPLVAATVITSHQLTPELAEPISRAGLVVFVDASAEGEPGQVASAAVSPPDGSSLTFSHDVEPQTLLGLAGALYGAWPPAIVVSVAGQDFGYGNELSPVVRAAIPRALAAVRSALSAHASQRATAASLAMIPAAESVGPSGGHSHA